MTKADKREFAGFCQQSTDAQLRNIYIKESLARRSAYAAIAMAELKKRGAE